MDVRKRERVRENSRPPMRALRVRKLFIWRARVSRTFQG